MATTFQDQVREFFSASVDFKSYDPRTNVYIWFGVLWGMPIPITTIFFEAMLSGAHTANDIFQLIISTPHQWFFLAHPVVFGLLFGILGNIRNQKDYEVETLIGELKLLSSIDPLTGLNNRRSFTQSFHDEVARCQRESTPLSLLLLDLDYFKKINDIYGHKCGDEVLTEMGRYLKSHSRPYDVSARWGGEEFAMLLSGSSEDDAYAIAERIRSELGSGLNLSINLTPTISIGVSQFSEPDSLEDLTERADKALYKAKEEGRNRSCTWSEYSSELNKS